MKGERKTYVMAVHNVNRALSEALHWLDMAGVEENSRNGKVMVSPGPVSTTYWTPTERVLFSPKRDANPFFHLMEALWMLAGRDDLAWPLYFNSRFGEYSDDGATVHGAYGRRWNSWFKTDQLRFIIEELRRSPESRRAVLAMWDPAADAPMVDAGGRDVPCNTHAYCDLRYGALNMTVCCRSNDALWGAYGANAVHFSVLQEYLAAWLGVPVGVYTQFSNNLHVYLDVLPREEFFSLATDCDTHDLYSRQNVPSTPIVSVPDVEAWDEDLREFMDAPLKERTYQDPFFSTVAAPMYRAWHARKEKLGDGLDHAQEIAGADWRAACVWWIQRREGRK